MVYMVTLYMYVILGWIHVTVLVYTLYQTAQRSGSAINLEKYKEIGPGGVSRGRLLPVFLPHYLESRRVLFPACSYSLPIFFYSMKKWSPGARGGVLGC